MLMPTIEELDSEANGRYAVIKVDVDENEDLAGRFKIMTIPTLIVFENGVAAEKSIGVKTKAQLEEMLKKYL